MENKIYVTIPDTYAFHCHQDTSIQIGHGDLTLIRLTKHTISITVGKAAFSLDRTTPFGTLDNDPYSYVFSPSGISGYVRLLLPPTAPASLQDSFERILIRFGLLKDSLAAYTDELARAAEESSLSAARRLHVYTSDYIASRPATSVPVVIDPSLHKIVDGARSHIGKAATHTDDATRFVGKHVHTSTGWITQQAGGRPQIVRASTTISSISPVDEGASLTLRTLATEYVTTTTSLSSSISALASAAGTSAAQLVGHEFGPDAQRLASDAIAGLAGVGQVLGNVGKVTSAGWFAGRGVLAALDVQDPEVAKEVRDEGHGLEMKKVVEVDERL